MDIKVHSVHFTADKKLIDYINEKVNKLDLFYDNIVSTEVFLRLDKSSDKLKNKWLNSNLKNILNCKKVVFEQPFFMCIL